MVSTDKTKDQLLTNFGKAVLADRYRYTEDETPQKIFARVAEAFADNADHAQNMYEYMSKLWFMPSTPILSNGGTNRGLPISCFLNEAGDSLKGIAGLWHENVWLAARGGGIGSYWGNVRSIGEKVGEVGKTSGVIPFIRVMDSQTLAISQGSLRRGSAAVYLPIHHPEIEEFIEIRRPTGGDPNRKTPNLHHGVVIPNDFMEAVKANGKWDLRSPVDWNIVRSVQARDLWIRLLTARMETGEPYMVFIDHVNDAIPHFHKELGLDVRTSNLCSEITLPTGKDQYGNERTAVCCLGSVNLVKYHEWKNDPQFIGNVVRFLDNVLTHFIKYAPPSMSRAVYSAKQERSIGLGVMGFHSFLQSENVPFESEMARSLNRKMFARIRSEADRFNFILSQERGPCPDYLDVEGGEWTIDPEPERMPKRFSNMLAVAPTASISVICGGVSPGIEPVVANVYTHKTLSGSFEVRNPYLKEVLIEHGRNTDETWDSIIRHQGSVQHLDFLRDHQKKVFKTAFELDQSMVIQHAADRTPYICQSQSVNLFLPANVHKQKLHNLHFDAWEKGLKSLYYLRSMSLQRTDNVTVEHPAVEKRPGDVAKTDEYEECEVCQ